VEVEEVAKVLVQPLEMEELVGEEMVVVRVKILDLQETLIKEVVEEVVLYLIRLLLKLMGVVDQE
jgi:hypothetical protein